MNEQRGSKETPQQSLFPLSEKALNIARGLQKNGNTSFIEILKDMGYKHPMLLEDFIKPVTQSIIMGARDPHTGLYLCMRASESAATAYSMIVTDAKDKKIKIPPLTIIDIAQLLNDKIGEIDQNGETSIRMNNIIRNLQDTGMSLGQATHTTMNDTGAGISFREASEQFDQKLLDTLPDSDVNVNTFLLETYGNPEAKKVVFTEVKTGKADLAIFLDVYALFAKKMGYIKPQANITHG